MNIRRNIRRIFCRLPRYSADYHDIFPGPAHLTKTGDYCRGAHLWLCHIFVSGHKTGNLWPPGSICFCCSASTLACSVMSEYHKMDTDKYPNVFGCHIMYGTNIRIYLHATNIQNKYLHIRTHHYLSNKIKFFLNDLSCFL